MKRITLARVAIIIGGAVGMLSIGWLILWLVNGGWPASGPTGNILPIHIHQVSPKDGEVVTETYGFCVEFQFQEGQGMGHNPTRTIRFFMDGINITQKMNGIVTLDYPPSLGSLCYQSEIPLYSGWHTAKVTYIDSTKQKLEYIWRFQVKSVK